MISFKIWQRKEKLKPNDKGLRHGWHFIFLLWANIVPAFPHNKPNDEPQGKLLVASPCHVFSKECLFIYFLYPSCSDFAFETLWSPNQLITQKGQKENWEISDVEEGKLQKFLVHIDDLILFCFGFVTIISFSLVVNVLVTFVFLTNIRRLYKENSTY